MKKLNCWEFKKCGRQPGGEHVNDMGLCPATVEVRLEGLMRASMAVAHAGSLPERSAKGRETGDIRPEINQLCNM